MSQYPRGRDGVVAGSGDEPRGPPETPNYLSPRTPKQAPGTSAKAVDTNSSVYSYGVVAGPQVFRNNTYQGRPIDLAGVDDVDLTTWCKGAGKSPEKGVLPAVSRDTSQSNNPPVDVMVSGRNTHSVESSPESLTPYTTNVTNVGPPPGVVSSGVMSQLPQPLVQNFSTPSPRIYSRGPGEGPPSQAAGAALGTVAEAVLADPQNVAGDPT